MEEEVAKPPEMDKTPKKNPFVPLQVSYSYSYGVYMLSFQLPSGCSN